VRVRCLIKGLKESKEMERKDKFFFFFYMSTQKGEGKIQTSDIRFMIHSQLSYLMSHDRQGLLTVHVWVWIKSEMDR
jgi:hypothetical protein